jgi:hypothetical protein
MSRPRARTAAVQVGEFAFGVVASYVAVGLAWVLAGALWAPIVTALVLAAAAAAAEVRYGAKATGLVVGVLPTALFTAALFAAASVLLAHVS